MDTEAQRIGREPTTPDNLGGFALAGGGNSPHRIGLRAASQQHPQMVGEYKAVKIAGGVELRKTEP